MNTRTGKARISMSAKQIIGTTVEFIIKAIIFVLIVMFVYRTAVTAYDYGYRVFAEEPVSEGEGRTLSVYVEQDDSVKDIGNMLQEKGLIRDAKLFWVQELLSENHGKIKPGIYDLNTSMTSQDMIAVMAGNDTEEIDSPAIEAEPQTDTQEETFDEETTAIGAQEGTIDDTMTEGTGEGE